MGNTVTIKDVAKELGIHHVTVSRALRDTGSVKQETRDLVKRKASGLGYRPNHLARNFRNKQRNILALLVPGLRSYFFSKFVSGFIEVAKKEGYSVMVFQSGEKQGIAKDIMDSLISHRVAGVVASVAKDTVMVNHFNALKEENIPYVFFDCTPDEIQTSQVLVNNFQGAYDAVSAMIKSGKNRIAYISTHYRHQIFHDRVPDDVAVIGFGDDPMGIACEPGLTTVQQSIPSMVSGSFELLFEQIRSSTLSFEKKVIEPKIIYRGSV